WSSDVCSSDLCRSAYGRPCSARSFRVTRFDLFVQHRLDPRNVPADLLHFRRTRQLAGRLLHAKVELLPAQVEKFFLQLLRRLVSELLRVHYITCRETNVVLTGSFAAASRNASRAISSVTPSIS